MVWFRLGIWRWGVFLRGLWFGDVGWWIGGDGVGGVGGLRWDLFGRGMMLDLKFFFVVVYGFE